VSKGPVQYLVPLRGLGTDLVLGVVDLSGHYHLALKVIFPPPLQAGTGGECEGYNTVRPVPSVPRGEVSPMLQPNCNHDLCKRGSRP
jgi:hypothetical protein